MPPEPSAAGAGQFEVTPQHAGERLDRFLAAVLPEHSRSFLQQLITKGAITLAGRPARAGLRLKAGDRIRVEIPAAEPAALVPTPLPLTVVYEGEDVIVLDKPAGLVVHPAPGHATDTLVNALLARYPDLTVGGALRPGIVHRLDKDTSGLIVVAKTDAAMASLRRQMQAGEVLKEYLALVDGHLPVPEGVIEAPIGRHPKERKRMAVIPGGREARSRFMVLETIGSHSLLRVRLQTGRTHQIRVHLASIGNPVEGDPVYGRRRCHCPGLGRQFLHAARLGFRLPKTGEYVQFDSELPADLRECLAYLRQTEI
jgi:23S rRNA pseudouridine1911/1915/1917 synthase